MNPLVSIIVPVYQVEKYIEATMRSIINQTYKNIEVILVDDGTKDKSIRLAAEVIENKVDYRIIRQMNQGVSVARNNGIKHAKGEWVVCVDSDDYIQKKFIATAMSDICRFPNAKVSVINYQSVSLESLENETCSITESYWMPKEDVMNQFLIRTVQIISPAMFLKKTLVEEKGLYYEPEVRFSEDVQLIWKVLCQTDGILYNKTCLYNYLRRENSTMTASSVDKIMTGYRGFSEMTQNMMVQGNRYFAEQIMSRWVFGVMHSSAKMLNYTQYSKLLDQMKYKKHQKSLFKFPDHKVKILMLILKCSKRLFYIINKKY